MNRQPIMLLSTTKLRHVPPAHELNEPNSTASTLPVGVPDHPVGPTTIMASSSPWARRRPGPDPAREQPGLLSQPFLHFDHRAQWCAAHTGHDSLEQS